MIDIQYLLPEDGFEYFKHAPHIKLMNQAEIELRTQGSETSVLTHYKKNLVEFNPEEMQAISWYVNALMPYLMKYARKLIPNKLCFVKLRKGTEWDYPFTLHKQHNSVESCIVLTEKKLDQAIYGYKTQNDQLVKEYMNMLVHEMIHLHQKANVKLYSQIYQQCFGMRKHRVKLDQAVREQFLTNPDGYTYKWIIPFNLEAGSYKEPVWFLPALMLKGDQIREMLIQLKMNKFGRYCNDGMKFIPIEAYPTYQKLYGIRRQLYHPNEISAQLIADYIINGYKYETELLIRNNFYTYTFSKLQ